MAVLLLLARLLLSGVFAAAGATKLADLTGSRRAMRGFGLPSPLAAPAGIALPVAELLGRVGKLTGGVPSGAWRGRN